MNEYKKMYAVCLGDEGSRCESDYIIDSSTELLIEDTGSDIIPDGSIVYELVPIGVIKTGNAEFVPFKKKVVKKSSKQVLNG